MVALAVSFTLIAIGWRLLFGPDIVIDATLIQQFEQLFIACALWTIISLQLNKLAENSQ